MGKLIVIEGLDGSGKGTQADLLYRALCEKGLPVMQVSFPRYGTPGARAVEFYLSGGLGEDPAATNPYAASAFFAVDRYISYQSEWKSFLDRPDTVVIANRYTTANAVHQLSNMHNATSEQKLAFLDWLWEFEFDRLCLPRPDLVLYLEMTPDVSRRLVQSRSEETGRKQDIHETDGTHLENSYQAALFAAEHMVWTRICCCDGGEPLPIPQIAQRVLAAAEQALQG